MRKTRSLYSKTNLRNLKKDWEGDWAVSSRRGSDLKVESHVYCRCSMKLSLGVMEGPVVVVLLQPQVVLGGRVLLRSGVQRSVAEGVRKQRVFGLPRMAEGYQGVLVRVAVVFLGYWMTGV